MQIKEPHKNDYKLYARARTPKCLDAYRDRYESSIKDWEALKNEHVSDKLCSDNIGISRSTYFRRKKRLKEIAKGIVPPSKSPKKLNKSRWSDLDEQMVLKIRQENPTYGKAKIAVILKRDHGFIKGESTVGRIVNSLKIKGMIVDFISAPKKKRSRNFAKGYAKPRVFKKYEDMEIGERVQFDHMSVSKNGTHFKHFQGWDRCAKYIDADIYSQANSLSASRFLRDYVKRCPFKISSAQVDGGSEFMKEFEETCKELGIELIVLPPRRPKENGGVERGNRTFREEFYARDDLTTKSIPVFREKLRDQVKKYNGFRPHHGLNGLTPMEYIKNAIGGGANQSHIL